RAPGAAARGRPAKAGGAGRAPTLLEPPGRPGFEGPPSAAQRRPCARPDSNRRPDSTTGRLSFAIRRHLPTRTSPRRHGPVRIEDRILSVTWGLNGGGPAGLKPCSLSYSRGTAASSARVW